MQCISITNVGFQCSRKPQISSQYCWQHKKEEKGTFDLADTYNFFKSRIKNPEILKNFQNMCSDLETDPISKFFVISNNILQFYPNLNWDKLDFWGNKSLTSDYREVILALSLYTANLISQKYEQIKIANIIRYPTQGIILASIVGSTTLSSDIDVTIISPSASTVIAIIEDLWINANFNHDSWKVDLYGDFLSLGEYYIDTNYFDNATIISLLQYAVISYFRHSQSYTFNNDLLELLIQKVLSLKKLNISVSTIIENAKEKVNMVLSSDREVYYKELQKAENLATQISANKNILNNLEQLVIQLAEANLYRSENYILITTVIQIVKIEQSGISDKGICNSLLTTIPTCTMSPCIYYFNIIEQLGYMMQKLATSDLDCTVAGGKYFSRIVTALRKLGYNVGELEGISSSLNLQKKEFSNKGNLNIQCKEKIDLYNLLLEKIN